MENIKRIFKHVWPQWPRLVVILLCALLISVLFSLSFITLVPLLKVMMGQEGLNGYADRKICSHRYGLEFYLYDQVDYSDPNNADVAYHLLVTDVARKTPADDAGLREQDYIVGAGNSLIDDETDRIPSSGLLEELSSAAGNTKITIQYKRIDGQGRSEFYTGVLISGAKPFYLNWVEKAMGFVPRGQSRQNKTKAMSFIILLLGVFTLGRCIATFFQKYLANKITETAISDLRKETFAHIIEMPTGFFESENPSDAVSRLIGDTSQLAIGVKILLGKTLREPLKALSLLICAMYLDFNLTMIFLCGAPLTIGVVYRLGRKIKRASKKRLVSWSMMLGKLEEAFGAVKIIKVYNRQKYENQSFERINKGLLKQLLRIAKVSAVTGPIMETLGMAAGCVALLFGIHWITKGGLDASEFLVFVGIIGAAAESVRKSSDIWNKVQQANAAGERVYEILDRAVELEEPAAVELPRLKNKIEFRDVIFTYPKSEQPVLKGVNLTVQAGHNVAIVGPNGSGKTTLVNLIPRFYNVDSGTVTIDGYDIRNCTLKSLRSQIGMVTQKVVTFNDTITANIAYGKTSASEEEIIAAARRAFAHEFISLLPDGYNTVIGEHGTGLSGGQLQRIVIARAILKNPAILIFDEATSQVDADSEAKIHSAIEEIMRDRTSFIIAHRFSTIISADVIVVMDDGRIIAQGRHEELIKTSLLYRSLYETQLVKA